MSIKKKLGLENLPIKEHELMQKIFLANLKQKSEIEFLTPSGKKITLHLKGINKQGVMQGNYRAFKKGPYK